MTQSDRQANIGLIRDRAIASNPSILDLTHGCLVSFHRYQSGTNNEGGSDDYTPESWGTGYVVENKDTLVMSGYHFDCDEYYVEHIKNGYDEDMDVHIEIIGRELTIADIMLALYPADQKLQDFPNSATTICMDTQGEIFKFTITVKGEYSHEEMFKWDLSKTFEEQEDSVLQAIASLLK